MRLFRRRLRPEDELAKANEELNEKVFELEIVLKRRESRKNIEIGFDFNPPKR